MFKLGRFHARVVVGIATVVMLICLNHDVFGMQAGSFPSHILRRYRGSSSQTLPWYSTFHRPFWASSRMTTPERDQLQVQAVGLAAKLAHMAFGTTDYFRKKVPGAGGIKERTQAVMAARSTIDCWTRGEWVPDELPDPIHHHQDPLYGTCDANFHKRHHHPNSSSSETWRPAVRFRWKPTCRFHEARVDPHRWCQLLRGRNILIVGDLIQYQMHDLLLDVFRDDSSVCYGELGCKMHTLCDAPENEKAFVRYLRNDLLSTVDTNELAANASGAIVTVPFLTGPILQDYKIIILNRAMAVADEVEEDDSAFALKLIDTLTALRRMNPDALVIYRSSFPGHPFCDEAERPLSRLLTDSELRILPYGWSEVRRQNAMARSIVEAAGGVFIDLGSVAELRPDGHVGGSDCLRYCMPGPLDAWATILYNAMLHLEGVSF